MGDKRQKEMRRNNRTFFLEGFYMLVYLWAGLFYMEIILRLNTNSPFINNGLWYGFLFSGVTGFFIYVLASFFKERGRTIAIGILLFLATILFASQLIYYKIFNMFYTVFSARNGAQILEFMNDIMAAIGENLFWLVMLFIPFIIFLVLRSPRRSRNFNYKVTWTERALVLVSSLGLFGLSILSLNLGDKEINSPYNLYYQNNYPVASVNRLGLLTTMRLDLERTLLGFDLALAPPPSAKGDNSLAEANSPEGNEETPTEDILEPEVAFQDQVMDINYDDIINETIDEDLKNMHTYFSQREPTKENIMTGKYKGYNLIIITAEAYAGYAVHKDVTPTLHKMQEEGVKFTNFYNPLWGVSTSDGEYVANTGLIPKNGVWSMYKSADIDMPFAMGNQLSRLGYSTRAYHNHTFDYYNRDISHPNLGYDYKGLGSGLDVTPTWPESDLEMMELTVPEFNEDVPFHTYYMTVSGHMRYTFSDNYIAGKNRALVQDLPYTEAGKAYMATQVELDKALEYLLIELEEAGVLDHTLIAISADHYPYGLENSEISDIIGHPVEENFELYKSSFILYNSKMEPMTIDRPVSSLDIIPTISNMMGLEFDSRLMMGIDMFSDKEPLVIFNNRSFITDKGRYDAQAKTFTLDKGIIMSEEEKLSYRKSISNEIDRQFYYSARILETDYYTLVLNGE